MAVYRRSFCDEHEYHTFIKSFSDEDTEFNQREANELCDILNSQPMPMNMKEQAVYQTADTKIENALKDVNNPVIELSLITSRLVATCLKWSDRDWDKAMRTMELAATTCRKSMENARKVFGDKAFVKK